MRVGVRIKHEGLIEPPIQKDLHPPLVDSILNGSVP